LAVLTERISQSFSTDRIPLSDRQEAWLWNARQICGQCNFQFPRKLPFHGSISRRRLADLEMTLFASSAVAFNKYPTASAHADNRACIVIAQLEGHRRYCQNGNVAILRRGDATLIDSAVPWSSDCAGDCSRLYLRVPQRLIDNQLRSTCLPFARRIAGDSGLGAILFRLSTSLFEQAEKLSATEERSAMQGYLRILSACGGNDDAGRAGANRTLELSMRILNYIENHLTESSLGPIEIASALNISVRHVHRIFSKQDCTVADWIRTQRLKRCRKDLGNPLLTRSITEIAFYWGFNDSAHFSHAFKKEFRLSPRVFRSYVMAGLPVPDPAEELRPARNANALPTLRAN
jgi:AraC family transcriptional regulator, positive regulator of tynA and feaB